MFIVAVGLLAALVAVEAAALARIPVTRYVVLVAPRQAPLRFNTTLPLVPVGTSAMQIAQPRPALLPSTRIVADTPPIVTLEIVRSPALLIQDKAATM